MTPFLPIVTFIITWELYIGVYNNKITISNKAPPSGILHQFTLTKGDRTEKRRDYYLKKSYLAVFCIDRSQR